MPEHRAKGRWYWSYGWFWEAIMDDTGRRSIEIAAYDWERRR